MSASRISALWRNATSAELVAGLSWYSEAKGEALLLAARHDQELHVAAGVIAALSPGCSWVTNLRDADTVLGASRFGAAAYQQTKVSTYGQNKVKAWTIAESGKVFPALRGAKVEAFFRNIMGDFEAVTVDSHIVNAFQGHKDTVDHG
ncbi:MAG: DUF7178 family protein, partial [Terriglobia bacterium]